LYLIVDPIRFNKQKAFLPAISKIFIFYFLIKPFIALSPALVFLYPTISFSLYEKIYYLAHSASHKEHTERNLDNSLFVDNDERWSLSYGNSSYIFWSLTPQRRSGICMQDH